MSDLSTLWQHLPLELRISLRASVARGLQAIKVPEPLTLSQWSAKHFYLSAESSQKTQRWRAYGYQIGIMDCMSNDDIEEFDFQKSARLGYALALDTPIPTATGWTTMGEVQPGDVLFDEAGQTCTVRYCSPVYLDHDCYKITFCDGTEVIADKGHRWFVEADQSFEYLRGERGAGRTGRPKSGQAITRSGIVDTGELFAMHRTSRGRTALAIPTAKPLALPDADLPIPPYTLGLWLGDGNLLTPRITQHRPDVETAEHMRAEGVNVSVRYIDERYPNNATYFMDVPDEGKPISPWAIKFRRLGLLKKKHIPSLYLRASAAQRLELLRGLMDSDGSTTAGHAEFVNTNEQLARDVYELLASLGIKASMHMRLYNRENPNFLDQYRITFKPTACCNPFKLTRKAEKVLESSKPSINFRRRIVSVEPVASVPVRCIEVDSPSHLFLCSRAMIPTHNTKCLLAMMGYTAQHRRRNQAVWQPTDDDSDDFCKTEVEPMLRDVRAMRDVFPLAMAKSKNNTLQQKKFLGSVLKLRGGKAAGNFRRLTIAVAILDELDGFDWEIEKAGDPWTLAHKRLEGATFPKLICGTTPRIKGLSHIENRMQAATVRMQYHTNCPHCQVEHPLAWGGKKHKHGFKWDGEDPEGTVKHHCPHCLEGYTQAQYLRVADAGAWVSECGQWRLEHEANNPDKPTSWWTTADGTPCLPPRHVGFYGWTAISPQVTWGSIVREFLDARVAFKNGMRGPLKAFVNETLGETWEDEVEKAEAHVLQRRAEKFPVMTVPVGGLVVCAGVDVQDNRFEIILWAFGRGEEMWAVGYIVIDANPSDERDWHKLWQVLQTPLQHENGPLISIAGAGVDTGGHFTHQAYSFVHSYANRSHMRLIALKGSSKQGDPIKGKGAYQDINHAGRIVKRGVKLWMVGTDTAKDLFFGRLKVTQSGPGFVHFSADLPLEFFKGLTAEVRVLARTATGDIYRWVNPKKQRNEPLDGTVYAIFISHVLDLHRKTEREWRMLEAQVEPNLFEQAAKADQAAPKAHPEDTIDLATLSIDTIKTVAADAQQTSANTTFEPQKQALATPVKPRRPAAPFAPSPFAPEGWSSRL